MFKIRNILIITTILTMVFITSACSSSQATGGKEEAKELVVVDWGGAASKAAKKTEYEPFEKKYNVKIKIISPTDVGKLKAMVSSKNVEWDVVNSDSDVALRLGKEGLLEKLDFNVIHKDDIYPELVTDYSVGQELYFTNIGYNTQLFSNGTQPKSWADFWNVKSFPGARSLYKNPMGTLESALLADGVAPDKLYPLDVDRAFKSLDKIKKDVKVWWEAGAQAPQLLSTKEVATAAVWNGRVSSAKADGASIDNEFGQALAMSTSWVIPKGAPHTELAMKFIDFVSQADVQAEYSKAIDYAPTNKKAVEMLPEDVKKRIGVTDEMQKNQIMINTKWWEENGEQTIDRFNKWLLQ